MTAHRHAFFSRRRLLGGAGLGSAALLAAACGGRGGGSSGSSGSPAAGAGAGATQGTPKSGGTLSARVTTDPFDWDMSYVGKSQPNQDGATLSYNSLLGFRSGPGIAYDQLELRPELAERWESTEATTFTFHLRKGAKFHNLPPVNGRELTAADVKWSFEYGSRTGDFKDKKLPQGQFDWFFEGLDRIETPDASTVTVRFKQPFAPFLNYAGSDWNPIVAREVFEQDGNLKGKLIGTGPFQLDSGASQKGSRWVWKRNPSYWDAGRPYVDEVRWLVLPDDSATFSAFQTRQLDIVGVAGGTTITPSSAEQIKRANPKATVFEFPDTGPPHLYLNMRKAPLGDLRVRKAIALGIDRDEFVRTLTAGKGGLALPGAFPDTFSQDEMKQMLRYDPTEAKRLLTEAGFANGLELEYIFPGKAYGDQYITEMELLQAQLKKVGVNLKLVSIDKEDYSTRKKTGDYVMTHTAKSLEVDVDSYLYAVFHSASKANYGGSKDPKLDDLVQAQRRETDPAKRRELVRQAVQYVNDTVQALALYNGINFQFAQPHVKDYAPNFGTKGLFLADTWLEK